MLKVIAPTAWEGVRAGELRPGNVYALAPTGVLASEYRWHIVDRIKVLEEPTTTKHPSPPLVEITRRGERLHHIMDASAVVVKGVRRGYDNA